MAAVADSLRKMTTQELEHAGGGVNIEAITSLSTLSDALIELRDEIDLTLWNAIQYLRADPPVQPTEPLRAGLERIIGLCGDADRCKCGRPTGIPAIVSCAQSALAH